MSQNKKATLKKVAFVMQLFDIFDRAKVVSLIDIMDNKKLIFKLIRVVRQPEFDEHKKLMKILSAYKRTPCTVILERSAQTVAGCLLA